jgi:hypothetical protein
MFLHFTGYVGDLQVIGIKFRFGFRARMPPMPTESSWKISRVHFYTPSKIKLLFKKNDFGLILFLIIMLMNGRISKFIT